MYESEWILCTYLLKQTYSSFKNIKKVLGKLIFKILLILFVMQLSQVSQVPFQIKLC